MDYKILKNALTLKECQDIIALGESQYVDLNADQIYPNRYYPGFTLKNASELQTRLAQLVPEDFGVVFDQGLGSAINFINAGPGESLGLHIDKPLYEFDENLQVLPEYNTRECVLTLLCGLKGQNEISIDGDNLILYAQDVIIMRGYSVHELKTVINDFYMLSAFYCSDIIVK